MRPYTPLEFQAWYLRNEKNYTQREIARMLGVSESAISQRLHRLARRHNLPIWKLKPPPRRRASLHSLSLYNNI